MPSDPVRSRRTEIACGAVVLLGSFLLFWVQPLYGQRLLPWFGGSATVWSACLLFFQSALCLGYAYAHASEKLPSNRLKRNLHLGLLATACLALVFSLSATWKSAGVEAPLAQILTVLAITIGLPFVALSSTGPLVQTWIAESRPQHSPYRLYALSNAGALLALLGYLLVLDPWLTLRGQSYAWMAGFFMFAAMFAGLAFVVGQRRRAAASTCSASIVESNPSAEPLTGWRKTA